jgi:hypothetical protein
MLVCICNCFTIFFHNFLYVSFNGTVDVGCLLQNFCYISSMMHTLESIVKEHSCSMEYIYHMKWQLPMRHKAQDCDSCLVVYVRKKNSATFCSLTLHYWVQFSLCLNWSLKVHFVLTAGYPQQNIRCNSFDCNIKSRYVLDAYVNIVSHFWKLDGGKIYMFSFLRPITGQWNHFWLFCHSHLHCILETVLWNRLYMCTHTNMHKFMYVYRERFLEKVFPVSLNKKERIVHNA